MKLRCSALPLTMSCAASLDHDIQVGGDTPESTLGRAVHEWIGKHILGMESDQDHVASAYVGLDLDEYGYLCMAGRMAWQTLREYFPEPVIEANLSPSWGDNQLTGHADVLSVVEYPTDGLNEVRVLDWKTGWEDSDAEHQLRGYAYLAMRETGRQSASVCLVRLRDATADWSHYTMDQLERWIGLVFDHAKNRNRFNPGRWCGFCPRSANCPVKADYLRQCVHGVLTSVDEANLPSQNPSPAYLGVVLDQVKFVEEACALARQLIKANVQAAGGTLITGDGRVLTLAHQRRREISYQPAAATLTQLLGHETVARLLKIDKAKLEDAIKSQAPRGKKGAAVKELFDRLESLGAIVTSTVERLEVRRHVSAAAAIESVTNA